MEANPHTHCNEPIFSHPSWVPVFSFGINSGINTGYGMNTSSTASKNINTKN